jgi:nucleoside-diphosphate-sugar epimerase
MSKKFGFNVPKTCTVTGGSGFVGQRLVEMLVERGATRVVSFDIAPTPKDAWIRPEIIYKQGDITKYADVEEVSRLCIHSSCSSVQTLTSLRLVRDPNASSTLQHSSVHIIIEMHMFVSTMKAA